MKCLCQTQRKEVVSGRGSMKISELLHLVHWWFGCRWRQIKRLNQRWYLAKSVEFVDDKLEAAEVHNGGDLEHFDEEGGEREDEDGDSMRKRKGCGGRWVIEY